MSTFGDFDPADALDTDPPDAEAVARIFTAIEHDLAPEGRPRDIDQLPPELKALLVFAFHVLIDRLVAEWQKAPI